MDLRKAKGPDCSEPENPCHGALQISIATILLSTHLIVRRILFLVPPLPIPKGHAHAQSHESDWRNQQYHHTPADGPLSFFGGSGCVAVTHGATLCECGTSPEHYQKRDCG